MTHKQQIALFWKTWSTKSYTKPLKSNKKNKKKQPTAKAESQSAQSVGEKKSSYIYPFEGLLLEAYLWKQTFRRLGQKNGSDATRKVIPGFMQWARASWISLSVFLALALTKTCRIACCGRGCQIGSTWNPWVFTKWLLRVSGPWRNLSESNGI